MNSPRVTRRTTCAIALCAGIWTGTTLTNDLLATMLGSNTGASMLLFTALKAVKKTAKAHELEEVKSEMRRAEKGAFAYGVINLILGAVNPENGAAQPIDAVTDAASYTGTYWVIRKIVQHMKKSDLGIVAQQTLMIDQIPESYRKLLKQVVLGVLTHLLHSWTKGLGNISIT